MPDDLLDTAIKNRSDPFSCLPEDLLFASATGVAASLMQYFISNGAVKTSLGEEILGERPGLADRPDLAAAVRRWCHRNDLEHAVHRLGRNVPPEVKEGLLRDLNAWDAQMRDFIFGLTAYELALMEAPAGDELYGERCLLEGQKIHQPRLLADDDLLWDSAPDELMGSVPEWMVEEIVTCGTRFFHVRVGPHPVWLATVESDAHLRAVHELREQGAECTVGMEETADGVRLWLQFPSPPGDKEPPIRAPYTYSLSWIEHAWELLHLASVRYIRLAVVRLVGDGELTSIGSIFLPIPEGLCARLRSKGIEALRRLVGDDTEEIVQRIALEGLGQSAEIAFRSCENAKAEEILDEIVLIPGVVEHQDFVGATRSLARARARRSALLLDGEDVSEAEADVREAVEARGRALELLRATSNWPHGQEGTQRSRDLQGFDAGTVFVHLINRFGRLQLAARWDSPDGPCFELISCEEILLNALSEAVGEWGQHSEAGRWGECLDQLLGACAGMAHSLVELATRQGLNRLILSPTSPMELLPLHAAPLDIEHTATLNDVFDQISYAPTARLASALEGPRRHGAAAEVLVVAHSGACIEGIDPIGGPIFEAQLLSSLYDGAKILTEEEAHPTRALRSMSGARIIHVASHGLTHPDRWAAGLALQGRSLGEATLTTSMILAEGDFSCVDLVVLNACRTGAHESIARAVQTLRTLEAAFLARGARAVIATLWEITDLLSIVFSAILHALISAGADPGTAFRDTVRYLRGNEWRTLPRQEPVAIAESLLGSLHSRWRIDLDRQAAENPLFWATFKITGAV
ncbi:CHAT domain-containing protein [Streptomyces sp. NBC_00291]|uniref:CHAT domain-containing protein n=1 Tax=Streptomyces sp. NBC_00291 TaxID=2975704 RepID=UPI0022559643|nr:CHAT domain-containing protein [Streptomyces sp. NBC_00291]MCX5155578.1 CHAT domain-containing protein [Streptomyces sp. NBC_00291]